MTSNSCNISNNNNNNTCQLSRGDVKTKPQEQLNCPRCNSTNTKFCYYNNYSLTQPRYFCKTCRRYWTEGGSLRNVPVGGGSRKNKRSSSSLSSSSASSIATAAASSVKQQLPDLNPPCLSQFSSPQNPNKPQVVNSSRDLGLGFPGIPDSNQAMELLSSNGLASRGWMSSFIPTLMPSESNPAFFSSGLPHMQEFKPNLSFSIDHHHHQGLQEDNGAKILFPFGNLKHGQFPNSNTSEHHVHDQVVDHQSHGSQGTTNTAANSSGSYWSGMLDHGGPW